VIEKSKEPGEDPLGRNVKVAIDDFLFLEGQIAAPDYPAGDVHDQKLGLVLVLPTKEVEMLPGCGADKLIEKALLRTFEDRGARQ
jgi:hypothetical protein